MKLYKIAVTLEHTTLAEDIGDAIVRFLHAIDLGQFDERFLEADVKEVPHDDHQA